MEKVEDKLSEISQNQQNVLKNLATLAYEREIQVHLKELANDFKEWDAKKISTKELNDRVYKYSMSHARAIYSKYDDLDDDLTVSMALKDGILNEDDVPKEIIELVKNLESPKFPGI